MLSCLATSKQNFTKSALLERTPPIFCHAGDQSTINGHVCGTKAAKGKPLSWPFFQELLYSCPESLNGLIGSFNGKHHVDIDLCIF